jgi:tetratricopeptide (TPR) repeat protein
MLTDEDRALGHRLAGTWLERAGLADAAVLAEHYDRGGARGRAADWYAIAARDALERNAFDAALETAARARACGASGNTLGASELACADAHFWRGEFADSERFARQALETLTRGSPWWFDAAARFVASSDKLGHGDATADIVTALCAIDPTNEAAPSYVSAAARAASHLTLAGQAGLAERLLERVCPLEAHVANDPLALGHITTATSLRHLFTGDLGAFLEGMHRAASAFDRAGDRRHACHARVNVGYASAELGDYARAERALCEVVDAAQALHIANATAYAKHNLGLVLAQLARLDEALQVETESLELALAQGDRRLETGARIYLARIMLLREEYADAATEADAAVELSPSLAPLRVMALAVRAQIALARGEPADALASACEAVRMLDGLGDRAEAEALVRLAHAEALWATNDHAAARQAIDAARDKLLTRAAKISTDTWRDAFLVRVPENARTLALAAAWLGDAAPS